MVLRSGNPLLIFLQSYHVWVTSNVQVDFRFNTYSEVLVNVSYRFWKLFHYSCFEVRESIADISTELLCLGDLENLRSTSVRFKGDSKVLMIVSYGFSQFLREVLVVLSNKFLKFLHYSIFMFLRSGNPLLIFLQSCHVWVTSKIQVDFRFNRYSGGTGDCV